MTTNHSPHPSPLGSNGALKYELPILQPLTYSTTPDEEDLKQQAQSMPPPSVTPPISKVQPSPYQTSIPGAFPSSSPAPEESPPQPQPASPSPITSRRPSGPVRRFLSLKSLDSNYNNQEKTDLPGSLFERRPSSPSAASTASRPSLGKKNPGSWFRRKSSLKLDDALKANTENIAEEDSNAADQLPPSPPPKPTSPPPQLPELKSIDDGGTLGADDIFRNIR
ncbi:MAG: hypothetical protein M1835_008139 [Candelina submexicana]|nr:MAG: hypothetical protein M1835_008139 [Candelina submexicana]